jgi:hypothetical protein
MARTKIGRYRQARMHNGANMIIQHEGDDRCGPRWQALHTQHHPWATIKLGTIGGFADCRGYKLNAAPSDRLFDCVSATSPTPAAA